MGYLWTKTRRHSRECALPHKKDGRRHSRSAVCLAAIPDVVDSDGVRRLIEEHAVVPDAQPEQSFELSTERLDSACAGRGIAMNGRQNI
jgi:NOL1/NOP2/fmu family ribosome biogenesis protein